MRLKSVWINEYKNLRDFTLNFDGDNFLDIFVGKNGTGKSNFFEALVEIFNFIFSSKKKRSDISFDFDLLYEIDEQDIRISRKDGQMEVNGKKRSTIGTTPIPDNVIIYYSGHSDTIGKTVYRYAKSHARRNKAWTGEEARAFIGIGNDYKEMLLSILLLQPEDCAARKYVCDKLGIEVTTETVTLTLKPPRFKHSEVEVGDVASFLWGAKGISLGFVEQLLECVREDFSRDSIYDRVKNRYQIRINRELFSEKFAGETSSDLFRSLDNLRTLGMFESLSIPIGLTDGRPVQARDFSDGQFQSIYIYAISELFKDRNCITLLDEPDSFLHPEWQFGFLEQVLDIAGTVAADTNHVLLSSHSAATLISHDRDRIGFFDLKNGSANAYSVPKRVAVQKLSEKLIKYTETEQLLSIINAIQFRAKPILFTEGSIDPIIIKEAWNRLSDDEMPFVPFYGFSCSYLKQLLQDPRIHNEMNGLPVFGLFDFDKAFDQWNSLGDELVEPDLVKGQVKKVTDRNAFGIMLPLPENQRIRDQVVRDLENNQSFGGDSLCEIEHLFYGDPLTEEFFQEQLAPAGGRKIVIKSDAQKERFAQDIVPQLDDKYFAIFKPVFDFICGQI
ncbi:AAA family ATPase [Leisingera aquaemixtae]|uniref:ATP-dependent nuclease n=1 Tax=Leisingera aquaemixtae TaxID=1396826 RepID=UPI0021A77A8D|nr:AAA family ATPase [Leisingera aquaemixtae]UWQ25378.1 AAA family ATPase [Leisingera aquaemixtae]